MIKRDGMSFNEVRRQQLNVQEGFVLIEDAIADCERLGRDDGGPRDVRRSIQVMERSLRRALSLVRDLKPNLAPRDVDDGLHAHLRDAHEWMVCAMGFFFLFQKEWDEGFAQDFEKHCAGLHDASKAIIKHLEEVGFE